MRFLVIFLKGTFENLKKYSSQYQMERKFLIFLVAGSIISVLATYVTLTHSPPFLKDKNLLILLLSLDFGLLLILAAVVAKNLIALWVERKTDQAGAKLHARIVAIFSLVTIIPTILVAGFSAIFFNIVVQSWFSQRVETAIGESIAVAGAYLGEHQKVITANAQAMAAELAHFLQNSPPSPEALNQKLTQETEMRSLDEAIIFNGNMDVLGRSRFSFSLDFEEIPAADLERANTSPVIHTNEANDRVRALVEINPLKQLYLLVGRQVSPTVLSRIEHAQKAAEEYKNLEAQGSNLALKFALIFVGIAILLLLAAVLGGFFFANKLARPMRRLIQASEEVSKGNLSVHIPEDEGNEEFSSLISSYNHMTTQLESQREQLDGRRRFTEAVLSGVSAGVIGLDAKQRIHLPNEAASKLLSVNLKDKIGEKLVMLIPEMAPLFDEIKENKEGFIERQVILNRKGHNYILLVRLSSDKQREYVLTFDDITQLQSAERQAAWSDVARRIAHEIKNPLTPIQLSAERLKRRFLKYIVQDSDIFQTCIDTIMRQVGHIDQLVSEFSSFARMPAPHLGEENLVQVCQEEMAIQQQIYPQIKIEFTTLLKRLPFTCDREQMGQVLTNLIQNAAQAIDIKDEQNGQIKIILKTEAKKTILTILDNGVGFPPSGRERLTDPYVTFREKGTGLGLAIVKKIVEDHGGTLNFEDNPEGGAMVQLVFVEKNMRHKNKI
jgi:two-component system nitrogen regulation sensor histidine kinase NtrY